jgi:ribosomal protein S18 acetylase RimI-like enzyme
MADFNYRLQKAEMWDYEFLLEVYSSTRETEMAQTGWDRKSIDEFLHLQYKLQNTQYHHNFPKASYDIIFQGNDGVGRLYVNRGKGEIRIIDISLLTEYRNKGYGTKIIKDIITEADLHGLPVRLSCERKNNPALNLFKRLGFNIIGETEVYYEMEHPAPSLLNKEKQKK